MTDNLPIMVTAVVIAIGVMMFAALPISNFIRRHPTTKMLALAFLLLIGVALVADALHFHVPRGYLYFAIAFSLMVETLNLVATRRRARHRGRHRDPRRDTARLVVGHHNHAGSRGEVGSGRYPVLPVPSRRGRSPAPLQIGRAHV